MGSEYTIPAMVYNNVRARRSGYKENFSSSSRYQRGLGREREQARERERERERENAERDSASRARGFENAAQESRVASAVEAITRKMKSELPVAWMTLTITNASSIDEDNVVHSSNRHDVLCCENYSEVNLFTENKLSLEVPKDAHMVDVLVLACCALFQKSDTIQVLPWVRLAQGANDIDMDKQVQEYIPTGMNFRL